MTKTAERDEGGPGSASGTPDLPAPARGPAAARVYVLANAGLTVAIFAFPQWHAELWSMLGFGAAAAVVVGVVRNRTPRPLPWVLLALALATFAAGDLTYDLLTSVFHFQDPFPSLADVAYLLTYPLFAAGLIGVVRLRTRERGRAPLLDALVVTTACALLSWVYLIQPYLRADGMTFVQKAVSVAYPLGDILILCVLARLLSGGGLRNTSLGLLALGAIGLLAADVAYGLIQLNGDWNVGGPVDLGWVLFYVCWGAAALHPSMRRLTEQRPSRGQHLSRTTLVVLSATTLVAPGLLIWQTVTSGRSDDAGVVGGAAAVLFMLVMARLTALARSQAAHADREYALRSAGARLVAASDLATIDEAALSAVSIMAGPRLTTCVLTRPDGRFDRVVSGPEHLLGRRLEVGEGIEPGVVTVTEAGGTLVPGTSPRTRWTALAVRGSAGLRRRVLLAHRGRLRFDAEDLIDALASELTLAADRVALTEDLHRRKVEARFRSLVQNASDVILVSQSSGRVRSETPSLQAVLGYESDEIGTLGLSGLVHPEDAEMAIAQVEALLTGSRTGPLEAEWRVRHADGHWLHMEVIANDLSRDPHVAGIVLTMRDVSRRKVLEEELRHQAFHDSLTGLANRVRFDALVEDALLRGRRGGNDVAVVFMDVDDFKFVNDTLGHPAGDELLVKLADRIMACLRPGDVAARLGGDEFAICLESDDRDAVDLATFAQRILDTTREPFAVAGTELVVRMSIGISVADTTTRGAAEMLREADMALYAAKNAGKGCYRFFECSLHEAAVSRLEKRAALEKAIDAGQLRVHYQPIVRLSDGEMVGLEALVRWQHPTLGLVSPQEFVPLAEESGLVVPMGNWVLDQACSDLARWHRLAPAGAPRLRVSVNVAARQLQSAAFLAVVDAALARHDLDPASLTLEITESALVNDSAPIVGRLSALHDRGIALALDDFGTGYSSLSYLHRFPIDVLKIDRSFVSGMDTTTDRTMILDAIVSLARSLDLRIVAEGVEHPVQARRLAELGCEYAQGYLYSKPVAAHAVDRMVGAGEASLASLTDAS